MPSGSCPRLKASREGNCVVEAGGSVLPTSELDRAGARIILGQGSNMARQPSLDNQGDDEGLGSIRRVAGTSPGASGGIPVPLRYSQWPN